MKELLQYLGWIPLLFISRAILGIFVPELRTDRSLKAMYIVVWAIGFFCSLILVRWVPRW